MSKIIWGVVGQFFKCLNLADSLTMTFYRINLSQLLKKLWIMENGGTSDFIKPKTLFSKSSYNLKVKVWKSLFWTMDLANGVLSNHPCQFVCLYFFKTTLQFFSFSV